MSSALIGFGRAAILFFFFLIPIVNSLSFVEKQMLDRLLTYYDWKVRPSDKRNYVIKNVATNPMSVNLSITLLHLQLSDETLNLEVELAEMWYDSRLASNDKVRENFQLPSEIKVWMPQIQLTNRKKTHRCNQETSFLSDGARLTSYCRLTGEVTCSYDPSRAPFQVYRCPLFFSSATDSEAVSYLCNQCINADRVGIPPNYKLRWYMRRNQSTISSEVWSLFWAAIEKDSTSRNLELKNKLSEIAELHQQSEQTFQTIEIELLLYHSPTLLYLCLIFVPSTVLVFLSWITVFTHRKTTKSAVQSAALFGICIQWSKIKSSPVLAVLDIWMLACLLFVSLCIVESIMVVLLPTKLCDLHRNENSFHSNLQDEYGNTLLLHKPNRCEQCRKCCRIRLRKVINRTVIHKMFAILFPIMFIVFCYLYWKFVVNM